MVKWKQYISKPNIRDPTELFRELEPLTETDYNSYNSDPDGPFPDPVFRLAEAKATKQRCVKEQKEKARGNFLGFRLINCHGWDIDDSRRFVTGFCGNSIKLDDSRVKFPSSASASECLSLLEDAGYRYIKVS